MGSFRDAVFYDGEEKIICYRSGMCVYEEKFVHGALTAAGWNGSGFMLNVLDDMPTRLNTDNFTYPQSFYFLADGIDLSGSWKFVSFEKTERKNENGIEQTVVRITLESTVKPVICIIETVLDGTEILQRNFTVKNNGSTPLAVSSVSVMGGGLETTADMLPRGGDVSGIYELGYPDECVWGHEGLFKWHPVQREGTFIPGRFECERHRHPAFMLRNRLTGLMFTCQLAWSGGYDFRFYLGGAADNCHLSWKAELSCREPFILLDAGEEYTVPEVHIGCVYGGLDNAVNTMHDHIRKTVLTLPDARGLYGLVEGGMGPERVMDLTATRHYAGTLAKAGAETCIIDAGWYVPAGKEVHEWHRRIGDWHPDEGKYPCGIKEAADIIHEKGLLFGLWVDIESIGCESQLFRDHPGWALVNRKGEKTNILDFTNPEVASWAENELARIISEYGVDLFRLDNNINYRDLAATVMRGGIPQSAYSRYFKAVYAMYDHLRRRFPDVVFENCAGGGGRTDLGLVKYFTHTWVTDWQKLPRAVSITNGMTMWLPPELVDRLASGMESHIRGSLQMLMRHIIFGRPTVNDFNAVGTGFNEEQLEFVKHTLDIYKSFIRPFAKTGKIYHHTPESCGEVPDGDIIMERASAEGDRSAIGVFRLSAPDDEYITVYPRGIRPEGEYEVYYDNFGAADTRSGFQLVNNGIRVHLPDALTSELLIIRRK